MPPGSPPAEVDIDETLVRRLLQTQHPDLAALPIQQLEAGFDNDMYRLGTEYMVRLPRRAAAVPCIEHEQHWLPELVERLPLPISAPVRVGVAGDGYPWPWSILPWIEGKAADLGYPQDDQAFVLADFLKALHHPAPANAPTNRVRGIPLSVRAQNNEERMARLLEDTDAINPQIYQAWAEGLAAPEDARPTWLHGDLHARNVLVKEGQIAAIVDWGDITSGDRATDLAAIWMLLENQNARQTAIQNYGDDDPALWARAKAWAVIFGVVLLDTGLVDNRRHAEMGRCILERLTEDMI
ncbi:MAG: aminoglycoside phosphotransferase family protein [Rhodobiaceae bacterium]|nr:aminoglycoside phosphotransferase family protein [Rhodobiaceae bacterium]